MFALLTKKEFEVFILWTLIVLALLLAPIGDFEEHMPSGFRHWDKLAHIALFGVTGVVSAYGSVFVGSVRNRILFRAGIQPDPGRRHRGRPALHRRTDRLVLRPAVRCGRTFPRATVVFPVAPSVAGSVIAPNLARAHFLK